MRLPHAVCIFILLISVGLAEAQLSPFYPFQPLYDDAVELFDKGKYGAAQKKVEAFLNAEEDIRNATYNDLHANAKYMQALGAYHLEREDAEVLMTNYLRTYGANTKSSVMRYYLGKFYYERRNYGASISPLIEAYQSGSLDQERFDEVVFMLGYSYFMDGRNRDATRFFQMAARKPGKYQEDANYYASVILYKERNWEEAVIAFDELKSSKKYAQETRVYLANSLLKLKRYDELFVLADELIRGRISNKDVQVLYVVANASFERKDYRRTSEYFGRYTKSRGRMNKTDYFRFGYSEYKQSLFTEAVPHFERALGSKDSLEQVASYYLGFCFLKKNPKDEASAKFAFQRASQETSYANPEIVEDALFQSAKVSFATEDYQEALQSLTRLTQDFPRSENTNEARAMIGEAYLYTRDYPRSIQYFENYPPRTDRAQKAYQTVTYFYGLELYERPDFPKAGRYFSKAISNNVDPDMSLSAKYWLAETQFRQGDFSGARNTFRDFLRTRNVNRNEFYAEAYYGVAWTWFKEKNYRNALQGFKDYISNAGRNGKKDQVVDAFLRSGDCLFLLKQYRESNTYYNRVVDFKYKGADYAMYQMGESFYRQNNYQGSVGQFDRLIRSFRKSSYRDDALDRISEIYGTWLEDNNKAAYYSKKLVDEYPKSPLAAPAYNRLALASYNSGDEKAAIRYFKRVVTDYPQDQDNAQVALDNLSALLSEREFDRILRDYRNSNPDVSENLAGLVFNTGQDRFFAQNYRSAIEQFSTYIKDYKNGPNYYESFLFRARCYRELGEFNKALNDYQRVYETPSKNDFTILALQEAGEIRFNQRDYQSSLALYQELETVADEVQNRVTAQFGIAKNYSAMEDYGLAINIFRSIAQNQEASAYSRTKALVGIGNSQYLDGQMNAALDTFTDIEGEFKNAFGAESQFMITKIMLDQGEAFYRRAESLDRQGNSDAERFFQDADDKFTQVTESAIYMKNNYPSFNEWKARTFLVAADAYMALGNTFQAKGTLESLIAEDRFPDIQKAAQDRLDKIEAEENALDSGGVEDLGGNNNNN